MNLMRSIAQFAAAGILAALLCTPSTTTAQQTRADAERDPILKAMLAEMDRSMSELQLKGFAKPFFIQYRIEEVDDFETKAEFGAGEGATHAHERVARITVRVGDYKTDSSGGRGDGALQLAALDDDPSLCGRLSGPQPTRPTRAPSPPTRRSRLRSSRLKRRRRLTISAGRNR